MPISVESTNGRYGSLDHNFKYDATKSPESNVDDLLKVYTMKPISNAQMESIIGEELQQFSMKNVTRTPQERAEALRRQASAQHMIAQDLVNAAKTKHALAASNPEGSAALKRNTVFLSLNDP